MLGAAGWLTNPGAYNFDFSHTVTVGYQGPAGARTTSVSGVYGNIGDPLAVPEPGDLMLVMVGLVAIGTALPRPSRG